MQNTPLNRCFCINDYKKEEDKDEKIERERYVKIAMSSLNHGPLHELDEGVSFLLFDWPLIVVRFLSSWVHVQWGGKSGFAVGNVLCSVVMSAGVLFSERTD